MKIPTLVFLNGLPSRYYPWLMPLNFSDPMVRPPHCSKAVSNPGTILIQCRFTLASKCKMVFTTWCHQCCCFFLQPTGSRWPSTRSTTSRAPPTAPSTAAASPTDSLKNCSKKPSHTSVPFRRSESSRTRATHLSGNAPIKVYHLPFTISRHQAPVQSKMGRVSDEICHQPSTSNP